MPNIGLTQLFSVPIYNAKLDCLTEDLKNELKQINFEPMTEAGFYSVNKYVLNLPQCKLLNEELDFHVNNFTYEILKFSKSINFYLTTSWVVKFENNDHALPHRHPNSLISGVTYFDDDPDFGKIVFQNTNNNLFEKLFEISFTEYNEINAGSWWMEPKKNSLILFPSNLIHHVTCNESMKPRYSLAFNYFIKGKFGSTTDTFLEI
jgi:uncharacterized protein (TIGR02466 family)